MSFSVIVQAAGGLALFLLAMGMMTDGLKTFAGAGLKRLLERWTDRPLRGLATGILITGLVQSSSAVTVATIGFVNAGMLTLSQAIAVVFGANLGTTVTSWLVALVGSGFKISALALPILTVGVILRIAGSGSRWASLGEALAGFGLFFLGLDLLKDSLGGFATGFSSTVEGGAGAHWAMYLGIGFVITLLTQSSSATLAIVLTAAGTGVISLEAGAAGVIGASLGTTSTAAVAVLNATANARRLAVSHILFNLVAGVIALAVMPLVLALAGLLADWLDLEGSPAILLAAFHTLFKLIGIALLLPLVPWLARRLDRFFRSAEEDLSRPRYLDRTVASTPELAVGALQQELERMEELVTGLVHAALTREGMTVAAGARQTSAIHSLYNAITGFAARTRAEKMSPELVEQLTVAVRTARYLSEVAGQAGSAIRLRELRRAMPEQTVRLLMDRYLEALNRLLTSEDRDSEAVREVEALYQKLKVSVLRAIVNGEVDEDRGQAALDDLSALRRMLDQGIKAKAMLAGSDSGGESPQAEP
ncbi:Na/Pi cotransporter family protein [Marinobacter sp. AN1]|uniref:Na/Pi cotransporter family protein n=1 Tax=Marinobacter sp. AN1 TaxID=2886046 RepID=UPI0022327CB3|nr:Na/Pi symporter [Marinobacter sp. AN1]UZD65877.1 Na/Pi symporter [Marinobacter sp. AN1]